MIAEQFEGDHGHPTNALVPMRSIQLGIEAFLRIGPILLKNFDELIFVSMQIALYSINEQRQELSLVLPNEAEKHGIVE